jgi:hypothetical protein
LSGNLAVGIQPSGASHFRQKQPFKNERQQWSATWTMSAVVAVTEIYFRKTFIKSIDAHSFSEIYGAV